MNVPSLISSSYTSATLRLREGRFGSSACGICERASTSG